MKCVVCNSEDIFDKNVTEEFRHGNDVILVPIRTLVCSSCGERYYSKQAVRKMEEIEKQIEAETLPVKTVGKVMLAG
jgi:YgiT-type zinc finger domain-containing protein